MTLVPVTATAPSCWASYLINGDSSGIEPEDIAAADAFVRDAFGGILPCDCKDAGFLWRHHASHIMPLGADCQHYIALIERLEP